MSDLAASPMGEPDERKTLWKFLRTRWHCFRDGHHWVLNEPWGGPDFCEDCGKVV